MPQSLTRSVSTLFLQIGSALPDTTLYEGSPDDKVTLPNLFKGKKGVLFGVPGAYTPVCSKVAVTRLGTAAAAVILSQSQSFSRSAGQSKVISLLSAEPPSWVRVRLRQAEGGWS